MTAGNAGNYKTTWVQIYSALAIVVLAVVGASLYLNYRLVRTYGSTVEASVRWGVIDADLARLHGAAFAFGSSVDLSSDDSARRTPARLSTTLETYDRAFAAFTEHLDEPWMTMQAINAPHIDRLKADRSVVGESAARLIELISQAAYNEAGIEFLQLVHSNYRLIDHLGDLTADLRAKENEDTIRGHISLSKLSREQVYSALLFVCLAVAAPIVGYRVAKRARASHEALVAHAKASRDSERLFRAVFNQKSGMLAILDRDGRLVDLNRQPLSRCQLRKEDVVGMPLWETPWYQRLPAVQRQIRDDIARVASGDSIHQEVFSFTTDGERRFGERWVTPIRDEEGKVEFLLYEGYDITHRLRVEQRLAHLASIIEATSDCVATTTLAGDFTYINRAGREMLGFDADEDVSAVNLAETVSPETGSRIFEEGFPTVLSGGVWQTEGHNLSRSGEEIPVSAVVVLHRNPQGEPEYVSAICRDISERKRAEHELLLAHSTTRRLLESIPSILIGIDSKARISSWNDAAQATFAKSSAEMLGKVFADCDLPWDYDRIAKGLLECVDLQRGTTLDSVRFSRTGGRPGLLNVRISLVEAEPGEHCGFLIVADDITEHKLLAEQLTQAQKLESIGQLAAGIAHEINTPIQFVGDNIRFFQDSFNDLVPLFAVFGRLLEDGKSGAVGEELVNAADEVQKSAELGYLLEEIPNAIQETLNGIGTIASIVRSMKEFSHPGTAEMTPMDLNAAIQNTITVSRNEWKYVSDLETDLDGALPPVPCLPGEFNQVMLNVIVNAAQAIRDVVGGDGTRKGIITVRTLKSGKWAEIQVKDTGCGIPEQILPHIFDPFFTTKEVGQGTGQGLAIAHSVIVEKHKGTIACRTEVGKGSTFVIRLPLEEGANHSHMAA